MTAQTWFEWGIPLVALAIGLIGFFALAFQSRTLDRASLKSSRDHEDARRLAKF